MVNSLDGKSMFLVCVFTNGSKDFAVQASYACFLPFTFPFFSPTCYLFAFGSAFFFNIIFSLTCYPGYCGPSDVRPGTLKFRLNGRAGLSRGVGGLSLAETEDGTSDYSHSKSIDPFLPLAFPFPQGSSIDTVSDFGSLCAHCPHESSLLFSLYN